MGYNYIDEFYEHVNNTNIAHKKIAHEQNVKKYVKNVTQKLYFAMYAHIRLDIAFLISDFIFTGLGSISGTRLSLWVHADY